MSLNTVMSLYTGQGKKLKIWLKDRFYILQSPQGTKAYSETLDACSPESDVETDKTLENEK